MKVIATAIIDHKTNTLHVVCGHSKFSAGDISAIAAASPVLTMAVGEGVRRRSAFRGVVSAFADNYTGDDNGKRKDVAARMEKAAEKTLSACAASLVAWGTVEVPHLSIVIGM